MCVVKCAKFVGYNKKMLVLIGYRFVINKCIKMKKLFLPLLIFSISIIGCKKTVTVSYPIGNITSPEYIDSLLFVTKNNYQITTSQPATFSSTDTHIKLTSTGLIQRLTSSEVVPILIKWNNKNITPTTIYALGATDNNQDYPFTKYQGLLATDPFASYLQGWKTLHLLPVAGETYTIVLRHADASYGTDWSNAYTYAGPPNWWKSTDTLLARQLNPQGIERATELGQIFKDLKYPIKRIITSEFQRSIQTAQLMNVGPINSEDGRINNLAYNVYPPGIFLGLVAILEEQPVDGQMTLIITHHPVNELVRYPEYSSFPPVSPYNWTAAYILKMAQDKSFTFEGAVSWGMFKYWRDLKISQK